MTYNDQKHLLEKEKEKSNKTPKEAEIKKKKLFVVQIQRILLLDTNALSRATDNSLQRTIVGFDSQ